MMWALVRDYCENSTIHGIRYLTADKRHWVERIFWLTAVVMSAYGMFILAAASWNAFETHAVSFVTDTNYLRWNTSFPAVSVCEIIDKKAIIAYIQDHKLDKRKLFMYLKSIVMNPEDCSSCSSCGTGCPENYHDIINEIYKGCDDVFEQCFWNNIEFPCCNNFFPLNTELGPCFAINSQLNRPKDSSNLVKMISNHEIGPGVLVFHIKTKADVFLHSPQEVPYKNHPTEDKLIVSDMGVFKEHRFKLKEIKNDPLLRHLTVESRGCRFWDEPQPGSPHKRYGYTICVVECRMRAMVDLCNCTHFFQLRLPNVPECNAKGLACIYNNRVLLGSVRKPWENIIGLVCNCTLPCTELDMDVVWMNEAYKDDPESSNEIRIVMDSLPHERYQRNVIRTKLDLVVSLGGTAGLFLGASLLSGFELLIYILVRSLSSRSHQQKQPETRHLQLGDLIASDKNHLQPSNLVLKRQNYPRRNVINYHQNPLYLGH